MTRWKWPIMGGLLVAVLTVLSGPLWNEPVTDNINSGGNLLVNGIAGIIVGALAMIVLFMIGKRR